MSKFENQQQYVDYLASKAGMSHKMITRPVRLTDGETGEVIYSNEGIFEQKPWTFGNFPSGLFLCPNETCQNPLPVKEHIRGATFGVICSRCRNYWNIGEIKKAQKKYAKHMHEQAQANTLVQQRREKFAKDKCPKPRS